MQKTPVVFVMHWETGYQALSFSASNEDHLFWINCFCLRWMILEANKDWKWHLSHDWRCFSESTVFLSKLRNAHLDTKARMGRFPSVHLYFPYCWVGTRNWWRSPVARSCWELVFVILALQYAVPYSKSPFWIHRHIYIYILYIVIYQHLLRTPVKVLVCIYVMRLILQDDCLE